jgi:hypothetical protein
MHLGVFFELLNGRQSDITLSFVNEYLWRGSKTVAYWYRKYAVLNGFNRFLSSQGFSQLIPLPKEKPQITRPFVPYVLNSYELARFFAALPSICEEGFLPANTARLLVRDELALRCRLNILGRSRRLRGFLSCLPRLRPTRLHRSGYSRSPFSTQRSILSLGDFRLGGFGTAWTFLC